MELKDAVGGEAECRKSRAPALRWGALAVADQLVYGATNFLTGILVARAAGHQELGFYAIGSSFAFAGLDIQNSLVLIPYTVLAPRRGGDGESARFGGSALLHTAGLSLAALALFMILGGLVPWGVRPLGSAAACWALAMAAPPYFLRQHARLVSFAHLRMGEALGIDLTVAACQLGGMGVLAWAGALDSAAEAYAMMGFACAVGVIPWLVRNRNVLRPSLAAAIGHFRENWHFSRWLITTTPVAVVRSQLPLWLLMLSAGAGPCGFFSACVAITALANPFLTGVNNFIGSRAAHLAAGENEPSLRRFVFGSTALIGGVMTLFAAAVLAAGDRLPMLMYGPAYGGLGAPVAILAAAVLAGSLSGPAYRGLLALKRSDITLTTEVLMCAVQLTLGAWLILRYGIFGAALAVLAGNLAGAVWQFGIFAHRSRGEALAQEEAA